MKLSILKLSSAVFKSLTGQFYLPTTTYLEMGSSVYLREWREGFFEKNEECLRNWFFSLSSVCDEGRWMVGHLAMASPVVNSTSRLRFMITTTTKKGSITWWVLQMTGHRHLLGKQN